MGHPACRRPSAGLGARGGRSSTHCLDRRPRAVPGRAARRPPGLPWEQGTDLGYLRELLGYWAVGFDWRARERWLNSFRHFRAEVDGVRVHFVYEQARSGHGIPLILTHGWPSCFAEFLPLVPWLTDPAAHGIGGPGFDVVIPSLPGYGFSERPGRGRGRCPRPNAPNSRSTSGGGRMTVAAARSSRRGPFACRAGLRA